MKKISRSEASVNPFTGEMREGKDIPGFIASWRYRPIRVIGKGQWGTVYEAEDTLAESMTGEDQVITSVAIKVPSLTNLAKEQMVHRNKDILGSFLGEARFKTTPHVLSATVDVDAEGTPYVIMPLCKRSLEEEIRRDRQDFGNAYTREDREGNPVVDRWMREIAAGVNEWHTEHDKVHGDLKLDNFLVDGKGRVLLSDGGNATMASLPAWSESPRDNMGCLHTRAPELFKAGSHPSTQSDVYAAGALFYKMLVGTYPLEHEFKTQTEAEAFFAKHSLKDIENKMKKRLAQIPRKYRTLIKEALEEGYTTYGAIAQHLAMNYGHIRKVMIAAGIPAIHTKKKGGGNKLLNMQGPSITDFHRYTIYELREQGKKFVEIGAELGLSPGWACQLYQQEKAKRSLI